MADAPSGAGRRTLLVVLVAAAVVGLDQLTKTLALDHLSTVIGGTRVLEQRHIVGSIYLTLTFNLGAAFGLGRGVQPIVEAVVVVLVVGLLVFGRRATRQAGWIDAVGLGLLVGGALGNLTDRLVRHNGGAVIDFLNVAQIDGHEYWPVFNLADSSIVVGAVLLAVQYSRASARRARQAGFPEEPSGDDSLADGTGARGGGHIPGAGDR